MREVIKTLRHFTDIQVFWTRKRPMVILKELGDMLIKPLFVIFFKLQKSRNGHNFPEGKKSSGIDSTAVEPGLRKGARNVYNASVR